MLQPNAGRKANDSPSDGVTGTGTAGAPVAGATEIRANISTTAAAWTADRLLRLRDVNGGSSPFIVRPQTGSKTGPATPPLGEDQPVLKSNPALTGSSTCTGVVTSRCSQPRRSRALRTYGSPPRARCTSRDWSM